MLIEISLPPFHPSDGQDLGGQLAGGQEDLPDQPDGGQDDDLPDQPDGGQEDLAGHPAGGHGDQDEPPLLVITISLVNLPPLPEDQELPHGFGHGFGHGLAHGFDQ